jgi:hypothetical protein
MRFLLVLTGSFLFLVSSAPGLTDFSGAWVLDLRASSSPEPILKRLGASWVERTLGSSLQLQSTYTQTPDFLTVQLRDPAFNRTDVMRIDNKPETKKRPAPDDTRFGLFGRPVVHNSSRPSLFGPRIRGMPNLFYCSRVSGGGKDARLTGTLKVTGESGKYTVRRVWRKR